MSWLAKRAVVGSLVNGVPHRTKSTVYGWHLSMKERMSHEYNRKDNRKV